MLKTTIRINKIDCFIDIKRNIYTIELPMNELQMTELLDITDQILPEEDMKFFNDEDRRFSALANLYLVYSEEDDLYAPSLSNRIFLTHKRILF